ncbi:MAG: hypothetical protein RPU34_02185 [Candidatus Sedimenticola sp. (ex Thyasira tokunagai)]
MSEDEVDHRIKIIIALLGVIGVLSLLIENLLLIGFTTLAVYGIYNRRKFGVWSAIGVFLYTAVSGGFILFLFFDVASAGGNLMNWMVKICSLLALLASVTALRLIVAREVRDAFD